MRKIDLYHFGYCGDMDDLNPLHVYKEKYCPEILYLIATNKVYTLGVDELAESLKLSTDIVLQSLNSMLKVKMINEQNNCFSMNFPFFIEGDVEILKDFSIKSSKVIGDIIIKNKDKIYKLLPKINHSNERILYHIIGDMTFDGVALDYFSEIGVFRISKEQVGNRDYLLIGFEDSEELESCSDTILCSSNNYRYNGITFNSFGDSAGERNDVYRLIRNSKITRQFVNNSHDFILKVARGNVLVSNLSTEELEYYKFYSSIGYFEEHESANFRIPVFDKEDLSEISKLSNYVIELIKDEVISLFSNLDQTCSSLAAIGHDVPKDEIANELWHQLFGNINEYLVDQCFFKKPELRHNEGRYFQSLYLRR